MKEEYLDLALLRLSPAEIEHAKAMINPLRVFNEIDDKNPGLNYLRLMRMPEYLFWSARMLLCMRQDEPIMMTPLHALVLEEIWNRQFPMLIATRGFGKTSTLAIFNLLRMRLVPGTKIVACGASFRQSKLIFEEMEKIWNASPVYRSTCENPRQGGDGPHRAHDRWYFRVGDSLATFLPIGSGEKIRGMRANIVEVDEFDSVDPHVYETVIAGFAAVRKDPVKNAQLEARREMLIKSGEWTAEKEEAYNQNKGNQSIIMGTAGYDFGVFARYFKKYTSIIKARNNPKKLAEIVGEENIQDINSSDYSITRIPVGLVDKGFMDKKTITRARATMTADSYEREYQCIFSKDSQGFFKRSLIEKCTGKERDPVRVGNDLVYFEPKMIGDKDKKYVFGIDTASESDNFAIVIMELYPEHSRVVYCWTMNKERFQKRIKSGTAEIHDYFQYCTQKIRDLMQDFTCVKIVMDAQGGGATFREALANPPEGQQRIFEEIDYDKPKVTDNLSGLHILELVQFSSADWTSNANHNMKFDMENKILLFPFVDPVTIALFHDRDQSSLKAKFADKFQSEEDMLRVIDDYDTFELLAEEVEMLKEELTTIVHTRTATGARERWDTPQVKAGVGKKARTKKDRYSALLMANTAAREVTRTIVAPPKYSVTGMIAGSRDGVKAEGSLYSGNGFYRPDASMFTSFRR